jgi:hypothetical protein
MCNILRYHFLREKDHDFSKGTRSKFYKPKARLNLPVYLDSDVLKFVEQIARNRKSDVSSVVNQLLKSDIKLVQAIQ